MNWTELLQSRGIDGLLVEWRSRQERLAKAREALKLAGEEFEHAEALESAGRETFIKARDKARVDFAAMTQGGAP